MVVKAAELGIPVVASLSIPTSLAMEIATQAGITLVGRAAGSAPFVYGCKAHVVESA
jgi:FdhD protein